MRTGSNPRDELPKALEAARKAVELDDTLGRGAHFPGPGAGLKLQLSAAMSEFKRAIELNPNYATAHQWFGECLQSQGHLEDALTELSERESSIHSRSSSTRSWDLRFDTVGKSDEAIAQCAKRSRSIQLC